MSTQKLSPRQKMISMMYLVLTAMLAMNVSQEVLNAFVVVNEGIENSNKIVNSKNVQFYSSFNELSKNEDSTRMSKIKSLVEQTELLTKQSLEYIDFIKAEIKETSGTELSDDGKILFAKLDDLETGTRLLTEASGASISKGELMRLELVKIYNKYLDIIEEGNPTTKNTIAYTDYKDIFSRTLSLQPPKEKELSQDGEPVTWVNKNFYNVPVVATDVILSKIKNDIYSTEFEVLEYLKKQIGADLPEFDVLSAAVVSPKSYLPAGKTFSADIFIAASSSKQVSEVFIGTLDKDKFDKDLNGKITKTTVVQNNLFFKGDYEKLPVVNGKANFEKITSGVGVKNYEGIIRVQKPTGGFDLYPFELDYEVAPKAGFSVSPIAMNVLYIGLPNPLSITVNDSKEADVSVQISNGNVSKINGNWIAQVTEAKNVTLDVYGKIDGERKKVGTQEFRVKRVPDPVATLDGVSYDAVISKNSLKRHSGVLAKLDDFVFDVKFEIVSYDFMYRTKSGDVFTVTGNIGPAFSSSIKSYIARADAGDMVFFQNVMVKGPDKKNRKLNSIVLNVK